MQYVTTAERIGIQKGRQEGWKEGWKEGEARILLRQITLKFGPPSEVVCRQIQTADAETLLKWSEHILTAQGLDEVLRHLFLDCSSMGERSAIRTSARATALEKTGMLNAECSRMLEDRPSAKHD